jgi:ParB family chromosome partitioning protein
MTVNYLEEHERRLTAQLGRRVHIVSGKKKGRVELEFYSPEDLDKLLELLSGKEENKH